MTFDVKHNPDSLTPTDAARLWVANSHAANPEAWSVIRLVPHSFTDGVLVYADLRYDPLSRDLAAIGLAHPSCPPRLRPALEIAAAHGPPSAPPVRFPTALCRLLDTAARLSQSGRRFRTQDGCVLWRPLS